MKKDSVSLSASSCECQSQQRDHQHNRQSVVGGLAVSRYPVTLSVSISITEPAQLVVSLNNTASWSRWSCQQQSLNATIDQSRIQFQQHSRPHNDQSVVVSLSVIDSIAEPSNCQSRCHCRNTASSSHCQSTHPTATTQPARLTVKQLMHCHNSTASSLSVSATSQPNSRGIS